MPSSAKGTEAFLDCFLRLFFLCTGLFFGRPRGFTSGSLSCCLEDSAAVQGSAVDEVLGCTSTVSSVSHRSGEEEPATLCNPVLFWQHKSSCSCLLVMSLAVRCPPCLESTVVQTNDDDDAL